MGWKKAKTTSFPTPRPCPSPRAGALAQSRRSSASSQLSCRRARRICDEVANVATEAQGEPMIPGKKVVWHVLGSHINFVKDKTEWKGTDIVFEITKKDDKTELRFTHVGLVPAFECYGDCQAHGAFMSTTVCAA